jgi:hypothetical protein
MAKKSSKASSPSWRTLMRRATDEQKAGKPKVAAMLRAQAAKLRHGGKPKKTPRSASTPAQVAGEKIMAESLNQRFDGHRDAHAQFDMTADEAANNNGGSVNVQPLTIGGMNADKLIVDIKAMARRKDGKGDSQILQTLLALQGTANYEGQRKADDAAIETAKEVQRRTDERIVSGFIAEVETAQQMYRGLPPAMVWSVNSYVITKIVDALNRAGYTARGRDPAANRMEKREALMGKAHEDVRTESGARPKSFGK